MPGDGQEPFELVELVSPEELEIQITAFARITGLAAGVVRQRREGERLPVDKAGLEEWLLTPVVFFDQGGQLRKDGSALCELIRTLDSGSLSCLKSDLAYAHQAFVSNKPLAYGCKTAGLGEYIAPISVGGHLGGGTGRMGMSRCDLIFQVFVKHPRGGAERALGKGLAGPTGTMSEAGGAVSGD